MCITEGPLTMYSIIYVKVFSMSLVSVDEMNVFDSCKFCQNFPFVFMADGYTTWESVKKSLIHLTPVVQWSDSLGHNDMVI